MALASHLWLLLALGVVVGCTTRPAADRSPAAAVSRGVYGPDATRTRAEILALWRRIQERRSDLGHRNAKVAQRPAALCGASDAEVTGCRDTCHAAGQTCADAERICTQTDALKGDPWAAEKCRDARAACRDAREVCCACEQPEAFRCIEVY